MKEPEVVSKLLYSNCLFEAVKAKLNNWKNVKIYRVPKKYNFQTGSHYFWTEYYNGHTDFYEFKVADPDTKYWNFIFVKGYIYKTNEDKISYERNLGMHTYMKKLEKKLGFKSWQLIYEEFEESCISFHKMNIKPNKIGPKYDHNIICIVKGTNDTIYQKAYKYEDTREIINPSNDILLGWRYADPIFDKSFYKEKK